jgi:predicted GNAT superfamily acetyltransferase
MTEGTFMILSPATPAHFPAILALNAESVRMLSPLDADRLAALQAQAAMHTVVIRGGEVVAFLLAFAPGAAYDSPNYRWFDARYRAFLYVDRVVVSSAVRRAGLGRLLYEDLFRHARRAGHVRVACEFDIDPPNPASEAFHRSFGFREVGRQRVAGGAKGVSLQVAELADLAGG